MMNTRAVLALFAAALVGAALLGSGQSARAVATRTWTGLGATENWSEAANWDSAVPVAGDSLVFPGVASKKSNTNNLAPNTAFDSITFDGSDYVVGGNAVDVTSELRNKPPGGTNRVALVLGGPGDVIQQSGRLTLQGANTYTGATEVTGGVLAITNGSALGDDIEGTTVSASATLQLSGSIDIGSERVTISGPGNDGFGALQSVSGTNRADDIRLLGATVIGAGNSTLVIGVLSQAAPGATLTLVGGGKLQVESAFYAGAGTVEHGNLTWNASSQLFATIKKDGLLRGTGMLSEALVIGGTIWPGSGNAPGILAVAGQTDLKGHLRVDLDGPAPGTGYGRLSTGSLMLGPASFLEIDLTYHPVVGQVFRIVDTGGPPISGTFYALPEGAIIFANGYALQISYIGGDGNDITLTVLRTVAANLDLSLNAQPSPVGPGDLLIYTATVSNLGPDASQGARLSMGTPVGTSFVSVSAPPNWVCSMPAPSVSLACSGPTLADGATATFTLTYKVNAGQASAISGTAGVSAQTSDPLSANNAATVITQIGAGGSKPFRLYMGGIAADSDPSTDGGS